jgi:hypothetical protein
VNLLIPSLCLRFPPNPLGTYYTVSPVYPGYHYIYRSFKNPYLLMFYIHREMSGCKYNFVLFMLSPLRTRRDVSVPSFHLMVLLLLW